MTDHQSSPRVTAEIVVGDGRRATLPREVADRLERAVVETNLHLPGMFEFSFVDMSAGLLTSAGLRIGATVRVLDGAVNAPSTQLLTGEVTAIEGEFAQLNGRLVVRGYDRAHRLQRTRRTRSFVNMSDGDIVRRMATEAGLRIGHIEPTAVVHAHLPQFDQTDWDFLRQRAAEIGYDFDVADGEVSFRKSPSAADKAESAAVLTMHENLLRFAPRVSAANLTPDVEVRTWDPRRGKAIAARAPIAANGAAGGTDACSEPTAESAASAFTKAGAGGVKAGDHQASAKAGTLGPAPSRTAFVVADLPVAVGADADSAVSQTARALSEQMGSTFTEAEGEAMGNACVQAGLVVEVAGVPGPFPARWVVTRARHVFDPARGGYRTEFAASGRNERSVLGLASGGGTGAGAGRTPGPRIGGVVCGVVTDLGTDGRAKVTLPWLSPDYESDWAPVVQFLAGKRSGAVFLPEVGDEVLVGFEFGDPRRPYILGGIPNEASAYRLGGDPVQATGKSVAVVHRGFVSASGTVLDFLDELPPEGSEPTRSQVRLGSGDGRVGLTLDLVQGAVTLSCDPGKAGRLTIDCGTAGHVTVKTGSGGSMEIDGGDALTIKSQASLTIQSAGELTLKGAMIALN